MKAVKEEMYLPGALTIYLCKATFEGVWASYC